ncbi:MAG: hypothetical protein KJI70_00390 [Patescibacteria group bacterium]|nr:hypothetical protein [Patescibacteria group bacterium]
MTKNGKIVVFTGPMFASKTNRIIEELEKAEIAGLKIRAFRPSTDTRSKGSCLNSHSKRKIEAVIINPYLSLELRTKIKTDLENDGIKVAAFDEAQFFSDEIIDFIDELACLGINIIVGGLDTDSNRKPFGPMPSILAKAEKVFKLKAVCEGCHEEEASFTSWREAKADKKQVIIIGGKKEYAPLCRSCWYHRNGVKE